MPPPPDEQLIARMLDEHGSALALYAAQWTDEPDDCVQEALIELARQGAAPESPVAWLFRVTKRRALNAARGARRRRDREERSLRDRLRPTGEGGCAAARGVEAADLIEKLPGDLREIIVLRVWGGLTFAEIGRTVGVATATAQRRYEQALLQLQQRLGKPCPTE
ncbi:ECF RNA polymerase sigma factor SigE [Pseudobythopirellula maris]|uniref:ECF RNA polymerase sigma factor SigE n=1 Tax=Pseudobythopirellula maris TaxID=2527991 RepID=A0A5C5ZL27_9BACT|nr:sigma-70 family RNA polymerase sigma factor [Pseudobythopirellula maris]TWT87697.1 ECF RNA polymerase sigma factor SigE [Pseudobythopirellula maris]